MVSFLRNGTKDVVSDGRGNRKEEGEIAIKLHIVIKNLFPTKHNKLEKEMCFD